MSLFHFSLFVFKKQLTNFSKQKLVYPFKFFWREAKRVRGDATVYNKETELDRLQKWRKKAKIVYTYKVKIKAR